MTIAQEVWGRRSGLITPTHSTARSDAATLLEAMVEEIRMHLLSSFTVRSAAESRLDELEEVRAEANAQGWNGYDALAIDPDACRQAKCFLDALPTTAPSPEISADPDGEVALDWIFGRQKALSVSIGPTGRCTFAWMLGKRTFRGTDWLDDDGIPASIVQALGRLARDASPSHSSR